MNCIVNLLPLLTLSQLTLTELKVQAFFNPKFMARKCGCGEVFGFNVCDSLAYIGMPDEENALRNYIRTSKIGCNGKKITFVSGQRLGSHIKRSSMRKDLVDQLDREYKGTKFCVLLTI